MKLLLFLTALLLAMPLRAAEYQPAWTELEGLLGTSVTSPSLQKFVTDHALKKSAKGDSGSYKPDHQSYSLLFEKNRIAAVVLHVGPWPKDYGESHWMGYEKELPFGLKRLFARKDVIHLLGESDTAAGNFWQVRDCEVRISFSKSTGLIQEVYVWKKAEPRRGTSSQ